MPNSTAAWANAVSEVEEVLELHARLLEQSGGSEGLRDPGALASAVEGGADVFCTTDDALYRAGQTAETKGTLVLTPVELIEVIES